MPEKRGHDWQRATRPDPASVVPPQKDDWLIKPVGQEMDLVKSKVRKARQQAPARSSERQREIQELGEVLPLIKGSKKNFANLLHEVPRVPEMGEDGPSANRIYRHFSSSLKLKAARISAAAFCQLPGVAVVEAGGPYDRIHKTGPNAYLKVDQGRVLFLYVNLEDRRTPVTVLKGLLLDETW